MRLTALAPWLERGHTWWSDRSARERMLLGILAISGTAALLLIAVLRPLQSARTQAAADIRTYDGLAARLRQAGPNLAAGHSQGPPATIVSQTAAAVGLTVSRIEPEGNKLRVAFADASFEAVLRWVAAIERTSGLRVSEARIDRGSAGAGGVTSSFLLAQ